MAEPVFPLATRHTPAPDHFDSAEPGLLADALDTLARGYDHLPGFDAGFDTAATAAVLEEVATRLRETPPYFHPQYAGHMLKPPHPVARIAYALSLWINANNHAIEAGPASTRFEKECIVALGRMIGWEEPLGHLTGGGTIANLEALWVADALDPGKRILASAQAHYTHRRVAGLLKVPFTAVSVDRAGRMDCAALERELERGDVGTVVATVGTTALGAVDPLPGILELRDRFGFRLHADAAHGGYFGLCTKLGAEARAAFDRLQDVDSIVIDPHKHGLQPYGCGCIMFKDRGAAQVYRHESPYTYFGSDEPSLGEISLECSRPGAAATALWATMRLLPPEPGGEFAQGLDRSLDAARQLSERLAASRHFLPVVKPELDMVVYASRAADTKTASARARRIYELAAESDIYLALVELPVDMLGPGFRSMEVNSKTLTCLRSVLMKPEQDRWIDRLAGNLERIAAKTGKASLAHQSPEPSAE